MARRARRPGPIVLTLFSVLASATCGGGEDDACPTCLPEPAVASLVLAMPGNTDGGVLLRIGGAVDSVTSNVVAVRVAKGATATTVLLVGPIAAGPVATVWAPPGTPLAEFPVRVLDAADRTSFAARDLAGYEVELAR